MPRCRGRIEEQRQKRIPPLRSTPASKDRSPGAPGCGMTNKKDEQRRRAMGEGGGGGISAVGWDGVADFGVGVWGFAAGGCVSQDGAGGAKCGRAFCGGPGDQLLRCVAVLRDYVGGGSARSEEDTS